MDSSEIKGKPMTTGAKEKRSEVANHAGRKFESEFFSLAMWMMGCRLVCMGGSVDHPQMLVGGLSDALLGYTDHCGEMAMLCAEARGK
jgi:hypothetical protein